MKRAVLREKYHVLASALYILAGVIMLVRAATSGVVPVIVLGCVFIALGAVRLRDYASWRSRTP